MKIQTQAWHTCHKERRTGKENKAMKNLIVLLAMSIIGLCSVAPTEGATLEQVKKTQVQKLLNTSEGAQIKAAVNKYSKQYNVDPVMIHAIIYTESTYNPRAVSPCGAKGLGQFMPATFKARNVGDNIFSIDQNVHATVKHYKGLLAAYNGNPYASLAAYNAGGAHVNRKTCEVPKYLKGYVNRVYYNMTIVKDLI